MVRRDPRKECNFRSQITSLLRLLAMSNPKVLRHIRRLPTGAAGLRLGTAAARLTVRRPSHPLGVALGYPLFEQVATLGVYWSRDSFALLFYFMNIIFDQLYCQESVLGTCT